MKMFLRVMCNLLTCRRQCSRTIFPCLLLFLLAYCVIFIFVILAYVKLSEIPTVSFKLRNFLAGDIVDFSMADNETGFPDPIVPNVVHYVKFRSTQISFVEMISILSVLQNHKPDQILIHCSSCVNGTLEGKYWEMLHNNRGSYVAPILVVHFSEPTHIFGKKLSSVYHSSDIARILILMRHGGIFLDSDMYVVRSLHSFRHFEFTIGWPLNSHIGTQILIAHKNARFLKLWLNSYRWYIPWQWYYNAGQLPTEGILEKQPNLVHRVPLLFGVHYLIDELYKKIWPQWTDYYAVHLLSRHRAYLDKESPIETFDEENIKTYNFTFGQMARSVLYNTTNLIYHRTLL